MIDISAIRTWLFVPATRPERIPKAFAAGADAVIVDWEDAVEADNKNRARQCLDNYHGTPVWLRLNAASSSEHAADLAAATALQSKISGVLLPKAETATSIAHIAQTLGKPVLAVIETAQGMVGLPEIARAKGLAGLSYGCLDLANQLGLATGTEAAETLFDRIRTDLLLHSAANNLTAPIESIFPDFRNETGLRAYVEKWRDMGMGGMLCIHPTQIATVHHTLQASAEALAFARRVCAAAEESGLAVFHLDGQMIDLPVILRARRLLDRNP